MRTKMVSYQTDMKIPVRPAPAPPTSRPNRTFHRSSSFFDSWEDDSANAFSNGSISRSFSAQHIDPAVKKKPPPRPPPPKVNINHHNHNFKQNKTNALSGIFSRSNQRSHTSNAVPHKQGITKDHNVVVASLIDFDSPSSSPTFTTRSSSDGVSVNSFGSDGSASNNGNTPSGGNASLFESGFEDDFDFFGGLSSNHVNTPVSDLKDPWSISSQDPFSPPISKQQQETIPNTGSTTWFSETPRNQNNKPNSVNILKPPPVTSVMPTIIRAKPSRPSAPPKLLHGLHINKDATKQEKNESVQVSSSSDVFTYSKSSSNSGDGDREWSPPMPSVPPPPPPENVNSDVDIPLTLPDLPPRKSSMNNKKTPHGIALYDYATSHPDDLAFKRNDLIYILKKVNNEWLYGEKGEERGMFPANFIEVLVPLDEDETDSPGTKTVTALYPFYAQQWDDLNFSEGAVIKVLSQVNADWLYGEYQGNRGQFPSSFVDHIPSGLSLRNS